jgi:NitT/TauT family transport system ATP-binding protein
VPSKEEVNDRMSVHCRELGKVFPGASGQVVALDSVTFEAADGEFVCIVGPSGCGKTTLLRLIAGLTRPTSGELVVQRGESTSRHFSAMVFQHQGLLPWLTVAENIALGLEFQGVPPAVRRQRASEAIQRMGLAAFAASYPQDLSGGMRQRVAVGRAFLSDPEILLMDEPFGALDAQSRRLLQDELLATWRQQPKTVIYVTHDIDEASLLGDRLLILSGRPGRVIDEIKLDMPRPREPYGRDALSLKEVRHRVWRMLEPEVRHDLHLGSRNELHDGKA